MHSVQEHNKTGEVATTTTRYVICHHYSSSSPFHNRFLLLAGTWTTIKIDTPTVFLIDAIISRDKK